MKKGLTLVEVLVSMAIIAVILLVVTSVYTTASKNYLNQAAKSVAQRDINNAADQISKQIKEAAAAPTSYDTFTRDTNPDDVLILGIPARNGNDFVYSGDELTLDYFVYYLSNGQLKKKSYTNNTDRSILTDVTNFSCTENDSADFYSITCDIGLTKTVSGRNINVSANIVANLRNE